MHSVLKNAISFLFSYQIGDRLLKILVILIRFHHNTLKFLVFDQNLLHLNDLLLLKTPFDCSVGQNRKH